MQTTIRASRRSSFSAYPAVATLIALPVLAACSESSASETKNAIALSLIHI